MLLLEQESLKMPVLFQNLHLRIRCSEAMGGGGKELSAELGVVCLLWDPISGGHCLQNGGIDPQRKG